MGKKYDIAAYIWPAYTGGEPRTRIFWEQGMGEWQSVRSAVPKVPAQQLPRVPLWGYQNEADPKVMEFQIEKALEHGVNVSGVDSSRTGSTRDIVRWLKFDSMSHYQFVHFVNCNRSYPEVLPDVKAEWDRIDREYDIPYFPHISVGWDNNPRHHHLTLPIMTDNTPDHFRKGLQMAKAYVDSHDLPVPLVTVNSWNEWTEMSYLEPDDVYGYGYLEAIRDTFK